MTYAELRTRKTVTVWTLQRRAVVDRLRRGEPHYQPWEDSAAFDTSLVSREDHKRAYQWMGEQFASRMGRQLPAAPIWVWFGSSDLEVRVASMRRHPEEYLVRLEVPVNELLFSDHDGWQHVLWNNEVPDPARAGQPVLHDVTDESRLASWVRIFDIAPDRPVDRLQAVVDRIDSSWVRGIEKLPADMKARTIPVRQLAIHELGHAIVADKLGLQVVEIRLFPVGGWTLIPELLEPDGSFKESRSSEIQQVAVAGVVSELLDQDKRIDEPSIMNALLSCSNFNDWMVIEAVFPSKGSDSNEIFAAAKQAEAILRPLIARIREQSERHSELPGGQGMDQLTIRAILNEISEN